MENQREAYIVDFRRTPFSRSRPTEPERDAFNSLRMDEALGKLYRKLVEQSSVKPTEIGDAITGCALQADENWTYGGKHPQLISGLPVTVPAMAIDRACSSSLNAMGIGFMEIRTGFSDMVLAGGMEHMTHVPLNNNPHIKPNIKLLVRPEFAKLDMNTGYSMGLTAEKLADLKGISREEMDRFSHRSHQLASEALDSGYFKGEIEPVQVERDNKEVTIDSDLSIRKGAKLEEMSNLRPAFKSDGKITAGNSSPLNAGASAVLLASGEKVNEYGLKPLAKIISIGWAAVEPSIMGEGPVPASKKALRSAGLTADDIDLWEINEAFAVVVLNAMKELGIPEDKVNVHGGAISIGHPLGASGARLAGTLARSMKEKGKERGMATLCVGGGQGYSMILERV
ncbi:MAG: acetyl-CoA C-acetyltransferase [Candidatus Thermoplasmatota archaeon]|jgi:acetyl-CoA C-acetyltransferase|nr:acetyl-CoA C-acetyltransferase [Candidatus Thermoplasmatota archaeon]MCL5794040.1 acetyl-CoA C-acetyltransferase [Candidatus Thermoplasmatota archaeon]